MNVSKFAKSVAHLALLTALTGSLAACGGTQEGDIEGAEDARGGAAYPSACPGIQKGDTGLCVLGRVDASGFFTIYRDGKAVEDIYLNYFRALEPGDYVLYATHGFDGYEPYGQPFSVRSGKVTNIQTGTLVLQDSNGADLQAAHDRVEGDTCVSGYILYMTGEGVWALLPNHYVVDFGGSSCTGNEHDIDLEAAETEILREGQSW